MNKSISKRARGIALLCMAVYFASYITRNSFAVMAVRVCSDMQIPKSTLGVVITGMTICYGIGQLISGFLGDRISPKFMLGGGLLLAVCCNVLMFFAHDIPYMTVLWCINGFAHAMLWPPIVKLLSSNLSDEEYNYACVRVSWGSSIATIAMYLLCPLLLTFMSWRAIILSFAVVGAVIAALWIILNPKLITEQVQTTDESAEAIERKPLPRYSFLAIAAIMIAIILQGILRDGVTNWMPSLMNESFGLGEELSILSTVILAVFSMISFSVAAVIHTKLLKNEVTCAAAIFGLSAAFSVILYFVNEYLNSPILSALLLSLVVAGMHGINLMLITIVPKRFAKSGRVSTFSGVLNSCTYVGAAVATYGVAVLAESFDWGVTILVWAGIAALGALVCFLIVPMWRKFKKEYAEWG